MALEWNDETYGTGVREVDAQHRELFERLGQFLLALRESGGGDVLTGMVAFLESYCDRHFPVEEAAMVRLNAATKDANVAAHREFRAMLRRFRDALARGDSTPEEERAFVYSTVDWWREHVRGIDTSLRLKSRKRLHST